MKAINFLALATALVAIPAFASGTVEHDHDAAEKRLRGCLAAGAASAPKTSLASALQSVRGFCGPQIADLAAFRAREATEGLSGEAAEEARQRAVRKLNDEIAIAVSNFTGLTQ
jgi:hypothetical protein